jgi:spore coat polysaccharide biosynthesis protein SpsF (cytidylyltransferase family)
MKRAVAIVQARMGSTRLPGKVLLRLGGETVLAHVLRRCAAIPCIDAVCCATTTSADDDAVAREAERHGALVYRGSEDDVLERYRQAAHAASADIVMRVTGDCPLIDPALCGRVLDLVRAGDAEYACDNMPPLFPHGLDCEAFTVAALERAAREARRPSEREHVTQHLRNRPDFTRRNVDGPGGGAEDHRWTLDTEADYRFLQALWPRLPAGDAAYDYRVVLGIVDADPAIAAINAGQDRYEGLKKSLAEDARQTERGGDG